MFKKKLLDGTLSPEQYEMLKTKLLFDIKVYTKVVDIYPDPLSFDCYRDTRWFWELRWFDPNKHVNFERYSKDVDTGYRFEGYETEEEALAKVTEYAEKIQELANDVKRYSYVVGETEGPVRK